MQSLRFFVMRFFLKLDLSAFKYSLLVSSVYGVSREEEEENRINARHSRHLPLGRIPFHFIPCA
jgi:hypothetical protein